MRSMVVKYNTRKCLIHMGIFVFYVKHKIPDYGRMSEGSFKHKMPFDALSSICVIKHKNEKKFQYTIKLLMICKGKINN